MTRIIRELVSKSLLSFVLFLAISAGLLVIAAHRCQFSLLHESLRVATKVVTHIRIIFRLLLQVRLLGLCCLCGASFHFSVRLQHELRSVHLPLGPLLYGYDDGACSQLKESAHCAGAE
jgi:hypothetical protein